jgi:hypothetical protein
MHLRTLLILAVLVGALLLAVNWQREREELELARGPQALFEGAEIARIDRIRVDNLERGVQLLVERQPDQGWMIVDPLRAPAEGALIELLLESLTTQTAEAVAEPRVDRLALDPPRAVLEFDEEVGEQRLRRRLELGLVDLDRQHVYVRADGRVVRTLRTFESILDRSADDWRSRAIVRGLQPMQVVELRRRGSLAPAPGAPAVSLDLALVHDDGWYASEPWRALLDPGAVGLLVQSACTLRASDFVDDAPVDLGVYGLTEPALELELLDASGRSELVRCAPKDGDEWYAATSSDPRVYAIAREALMTLAAPVDQMVERDFARLVRERVARVALRSGGRELVLEQAQGGWTLATDPNGGGPDGQGGQGGRRPADAGRVLDLLTDLEGLRVLALLPEVPFEDGPGGPVSILLEHDGRTVGGSLGRPHAIGGGGAGILFQRAGDELVTLLEERALALAASDPADFEDKRLVRVNELELARIDLALGERQASFALDARGRWTRIGTEVEARDFALLVDGLLALSAETRLPPGEAEALVAPVSVALVHKSGASQRYELGAHTDELFAFRAGEQHALVRGTLHRDLVKLLEAL